MVTCSPYPVAARAPTRAIEFAAATRVDRLPLTHNASGA